MQDTAVCLQAKKLKSSDQRPSTHAACIQMVPLLPYTLHQVPLLLLLLLPQWHVLLLLLLRLFPQVSAAPHLDIKRAVCWVQLLRPADERHPRLAGVTEGEGAAGILGVSNLQRQQQQQHIINRNSCEFVFRGDLSTQNVHSFITDHRHDVGAEG
jgi:hypothetical protein